MRVGVKRPNIDESLQLAVMGLKVDPYKLSIEFQIIGHKYDSLFMFKKSALQGFAKSEHSLGVLF